MHGELSRAIDIPTGVTAANHSYKKVFSVLRCRARGNAERAVFANDQVQNLRQFACELEQHNLVRKLNVVTHLRSESRLDQLERLKEEQQRTEHQFSTSLHEREFVVQHACCVCDCGLEHVHCNAKCTEQDSAEF